MKAEARTLDGRLVGKGVGVSNVCARVTEAGIEMSTLTEREVLTWSELEEIRASQEAGLCHGEEFRQP